MIVDSNRGNLDYLEGELRELIESTEYKAYDLTFLSGKEFGGWALDKDTCQLIGRFCEIFRPSTIVEFGCGLSTLIFANELKRGHVRRLISIDHEETYLRAIQAEIGADFPRQSIELLFRPLRLQRAGCKWFYFYGLTRRDLDNVGMVDLLLIDGPPHYYESREASLYLMRPNLRPGSMIFLDDGLRKTREQRYLANWKNFFGGQVKGQLFEKGFKAGLIAVWPVERLDREIRPGYWVRIKQGVLAIKVAARYRLSVVKKHVTDRRG
jgi:predicted O-methyltransferase YrrM